MNDARTDLATIWNALETWSEDLFFSDEEIEANRRAWDNVCEAMARITEKLGYDPLELNY